jgi:formiminoglutamase
MTPVMVTQGAGPVILAMPHGGTSLPDDLLARLNPRGRGLDDTDWHIDRLYEGLIADATCVRANFHRYVIDANRDPSGQSLYPGQNTTALCPLTDFDGHPIYLPGQTPDADEIAARAASFHAPYHAALAAQVDRVRAAHGIAIVYDCHSIRSTIPFLFDGLLPVFNIGTNDGVTCAAPVEAAVHDACAASGLPMVLNGRFKGGWTTRHYGQPAKDVHAIQMELAQRAYLAAEAAPWAYDGNVAQAARTVLSNALKSIDNIARSGTLTR